MSHGLVGSAAGGELLQLEEDVIDRLLGILGINVHLSSMPKGLGPAEILKEKINKRHAWRRPEILLESTPQCR